MKEIIEKMRTDFVLIGDHRIKSGEWTEQDFEDVGAVIKTAVASNEPTQILTWSRWLADLSAWVIAYRMICAPINRCIELRLEEQRAARAAAGGGKDSPSAQANGSSRAPSRTGT